MHGLRYTPRLFVSVFHILPTIIYENRPCNFPKLLNKIGKAFSGSCVVYAESTEDTALYTLVAWPTLDHVKERFENARVLHSLGENERVYVVHDSLAPAFNLEGCPG